MSSKVTPIDQSRSAAEANSGASSECTVRVVLRDASGTDDLQWTIPHDGATLGSADDCELVCKAADIAPRHLQFFLKSEGISVHDLVQDVPQLSNVSWAEGDPRTFQIAGHQLELQAVVVQPQASGPSQEASEKMTGELEAGEPPASAEHAAASNQAEEAHPPGHLDGELASEESDPEHQAILETLGEIQRDSLRAQALQSELASPVESANAPAPNEDTESSAEESPDTRQRTSNEEAILEHQAAREAAALDLLGERASDVDQQLQSLERLIADDQALDSGEPSNATNPQSDAAGSPDAHGDRSPADPREDSDADGPTAPVQDGSSGGPGPFNTQLVLLRESLVSWTTQQAEHASNMSFPDENRADDTPTQAQDPSREWSTDASQTVEQLASLTAETITKLSQAVGENWQEEIQQQFDLLRQAVDQAAAAVLDKAPAESTHVEAVSDNEVFETSPEEPVEDYDKPPELKRDTAPGDQELPSWWTEEEASDQASHDGVTPPSAESASQTAPESEVFETSPTPDQVHEYDRAEADWRNDSSEPSTDDNFQEDAHWTSETDDLGSQEWSTDSEVASDEGDEGDEGSRRNVFEGMGEDSITPPSNSAAAESTASPNAEAEEESVEEYMQKLLARMRGTSEPVAGIKPAAKAPETKPTQESKAVPALEATNEPAPGDTSAAHSSGPHRPPSTALAAKELELKDLSRRTPTPAKTQNLAAMRELANSSARTAIHHSTRQRQLLDLVVKATIAVIGLVVGLVLLIINGFSLNLGLLATIAALFVAGIWGYDFVSTLKPLVQAGIVLSPVPSGESTEELGSDAEPASEPAPTPAAELDTEEKSES